MDGSDRTDGTLSLALPKGASLEQRTLRLFAAAGLEVSRPSDRVYRGTIDRGGPLKVAFLKPREIPAVVADGVFDLGLTGADWIEETGAKAEKVLTFTYSKTTDLPWRVVLAVPVHAAAQSARDLGDGTRVATEYPNISGRYLREAGVNAELVPSYGATEGKVPELADAVVDVVETGSALSHNGLRIIETIRTCHPQLIASPRAWGDAAAQRRIQHIARLLHTAHHRSPGVLLTVRVPAHHLDEVARALPERSWSTGTGLHDPGTVVVQGLVTREAVAETVADLLAAGAVEVTETEAGVFASPLPGAP